MHKFASALSKFKCLAAKYSCFFPLNLFSRYVSTIGSKRRYHSARMCVHVAGRDSCRFCTMFSIDVAKTLIQSSRNRFFRRTSQARTVLLFGSYSSQIFPSRIRNLLTRRRKKYQVCTKYRLLCAIGSEMNYPPSLKFNDPTLTDQ